MRREVRRARLLLHAPLRACLCGGPRRLYGRRRAFELARYAALARAVHQCGVMVHPSDIEPWFVSMVHTQADIDRTLDAFEDAVGATRSPLLVASA